MSNPGRSPLLNSSPEIYAFSGRRLPERADAHCRSRGRGHAPLAADASGSPLANRRRWPGCGDPDFTRAVAITNHMSDSSPSQSDAESEPTDGARSETGGRSHDGPDQLRSDVLGFVDYAKR